MNDIGARIRERRTRMGWTIQKLAAIAGLDQSFVSRMERGKTSYTAESLLKIAGAFAVDIPTLYSSVKSNVEPAPADWRRVPVLDYVQAGRWTGVMLQTSDMEMSEFVTAAIEHSPSTFALRIRGDSMEPTFRAGDIVLIDPTIHPRPGDFVVATEEGGEATFKKYRVAGLNSEGKSVFELIPLNENYAPLRSDHQHIQLVGTMVEHRRFRTRQQF
ncbi:MAG: XRE family transcriptional regulator [Acidobacteriota bacterium]|nr:XRE family transcriptional regulator [Acidobacteriota bacterium]